MYGGTAILSSVERAGELIFESLEFGVFQFRANARWLYPQGFFASLSVTKFDGPEFALFIE
jgi:hypothetical protein